MLEGTQFPLQHPLLEVGPGRLPLPDFLRISPRSHLYLRGLHPMPDDHAGTKPGPHPSWGQLPWEFPRASQVGSALRLLLTRDTPAAANPSLGGTACTCSPPSPREENKNRKRNLSWTVSQIRKLNAGSIRSVLSSSTLVPRLPEQKPEVLRG